MAHWTKPYYGVQHLLGLKRGHQITITDRGGLVDGFHVYRSFIPSEEALFDTVGEAKRWAEELADRLGILAD